MLALMAVGVAASMMWGRADPTGSVIADPVWRGLAAVLMFAAAGTRHLRRVAAAFVGVAAMALIDGLALLPLWIGLVGVAVWVCRPPRGWLAISVLVVALVAAVGAFAGWRAGQELRSARQQLAALELGDVDSVDQLDSSVTDIESRLDDARGWIDSPWAVPARYVPFLGAHLAAADDVLDASDIVFDAVAPLRTLDVSDFAVSGGIDMAMVAETGDLVQVLAEAATRAEAKVLDVDDSWLLPWLRDDLRVAETVLGDGARDAERLARMLDGVWRQAGGERPQRWFVLACSPVEARATCGFPGNYVELIVDDGRFRSVRSGRMSDLEEIAIQLDLQLTTGGDYQARYERFGVAQTWRNITLSPHWPDVAETIRRLYGEMFGTEIDVVAGVNTEGTAAIVGLTGPVEVGGLGTVTAQNLRQLIEVGQYEAFDDRRERVDALAELTDVIVEELENTNDVDAPALRTIAEAAGNGGFVVHAAEDPEGLFAEAGVDGALPERALGVTWQNAAANKLDAYTETTIRYRAPGVDEGCLRFTLRNSVPSGLPDPVVGTGDAVPPRWQKWWLTIYSPTLVSSALVDGEPVQYGSEREHGAYASSFFVVVAPNQTVTIDARLAAGVGGTPTLLLQPASIPTEVVEPADGDCTSG